MLSTLKQLSPGQRWVIVLVALTVALGLGNLGRAVVAFRYAADLPQLPTTVPLAYFGAMGVFWSVVFLACGLGLSGFREWARRSTLAAITVYQINVWVNHVLFSASEYARRARPRNLILTATLLILFWGTLNLAAVRKAFGPGPERD